MTIYISFSGANQHDILQLQLYVFFSIVLGRYLSWSSKHRGAFPGVLSDPPVILERGTPLSFIPLEGFSFSQLVGALFILQRAHQLHWRGEKKAESFCRIGFCTCSKEYVLYSGLYSKNLHSQPCFLNQCGTVLLISLKELYSVQISCG